MKWIVEPRHVNAVSQSYFDINQAIPLPHFKQCAHLKVETPMIAKMYAISTKNIAM